jgi:thiol-disulfide isomerase/thioredoxin
MLLFRGNSAQPSAEACLSNQSFFSRPHHLMFALFGLFFTLLLLNNPLHAAGAVDFTLPDIDGKQQKLSDFRGKWVVVNYWATWCPPCVAEIPELVDFHEAHKNKDAVVVGVNFEEIETPKLREFVDSYFMSYPILRMKPAPRSTLGLIEGLPTSFLISPSGMLVAQQSGQITAKLIEEFIAEQGGLPKDGVPAKKKPANPALQSSHTGSNDDSALLAKRMDTPE